MGHLYQARLWRQKKAEDAARGEGIQLTRMFAPDVRKKICWAMLEASPASLEVHGEYPDWQHVGTRMQRLLFQEWGRTTALTEHSHIEPHADVTGYLINDATNDEVLDMIEAWFVSVDAGLDAMDEGFLPPGLGRISVGQSIGERSFDTFRRKTNDVLDLHDLAYQVVGNRIIERDSMIMHSDVVVPVLSLLHGDRRLAGVEGPFQDALRELKPGGKPDDAITDVTAALQQMLTILGLKGNSLGAQLSDAAKKGMLRPYDVKLIDWASAARSDRGDAHPSSTEVNREDAWMAVHVVGALLLKLNHHFPAG